MNVLAMETKTRSSLDVNVIDIIMVWLAYLFLKIIVMLYWVKIIWASLLYVISFWRWISKDTLDSYIQLMKQANQEINEIFN